MCPEKIFKEPECIKYTKYISEKYKHIKKRHIKLQIKFYLFNVKWT